jgi:nitrate reductase NapE component
MSQLSNHFIKVVDPRGSELELYKKFLLIILGMWDILIVATSGPWQAGVVRLSEAR